MDVKFRTPHAIGSDLQALSEVDFEAFIEWVDRVRENPFDPGTPQTGLGDVSVCQFTDSYCVYWRLRAPRGDSTDGRVLLRLTGETTLFVDILAVERLDSQ